MNPLLGGISSSQSATLSLVRLPGLDSIKGLSKAVALEGGKDQRTPLIGRGCGSPY